MTGKSEVSFPVSDNSGVDGEKAFIVTYVVKLPESRLELSRFAADAFACCGADGRGDLR